MTIAQTATTSFKTELMQAVHNFGPVTPDTFFIALYTGAANIDATTTAYTTDGEVVGTGYTAGGQQLTITTSPTAANNNYGVPTAYVNFADVTWANATFTARGALIYNATQGNKSVAVLDFGGDKVKSGTDFTIQFPAAGANTAIIRIA
jgi:hypothetical protein